MIQFGIKVMPFDEQKQLIDEIRGQIDRRAPERAAARGHRRGRRPAGARRGRELGPELATATWATLAGLVAVALVLLAVYRSARRALVPLIPIVFATGWSSLVLFATGVPLNPMSATLGALVIAIATEFSVMLSARYHEERAGGGTVGEALRRAYSRTGMAVLASGITAIAGFAVLIVSDIRMLSDFGLVTVLDLAVALAGVLAVLPAALVWAEGGFQLSLSLPRGRARGPGCPHGSPPASRAADGRRWRAPPKPPASAGARYVAFVGLAFLVLIAIATYNTVSDATGGLLGVSASVRGRPLPEFAVPNVRGGPDADANVFQDDCASADNPCPPDERRTLGLPGPAPLPRDPRVRPLQPAARDLVLVSRGRQLPTDPGPRREGRAAIPRPGELPLDRRSRRPQRG